MTIPVRPIPPELPVGYRFDPTDEELIGYYLVLLLNGLYSPDMPIGFVNFLEFEPWQLPDRSRIKSGDQVWYFFCQRNIHMDKKKRMFKRKTQAGHWQPTGEPMIIENLGKRTTLRFHKDSAKAEKTEWIAYEYEVKQTSTLQNPGEFVVIKLMNSSGEKRIKMKTKMSKQNFKEMSASVYDQNQSLDEVMSISDGCSREVPADFDYQNADNMSAMSTHSILQQSNEMASACEVMTVASGASPSDFDTSEQSNCSLASDFENQKLPSEIEDSSPKTIACAENQVTQDKTNPSCLVNWKRITFSSRTLISRFSTM